jgi:hypothetical protein
MITLFWILMAYGMSNILVYGSIFNGPRNFINKWGSDEHAPFNQFAAFVASMLKCMMCTSTWVGFAYGLGVWSPTNQLFEVTPYLSWFLDGMLASGGVWVINSIVEWFEENRPQKPNIF